MEIKHLLKGEIFDEIHVGGSNRNILIDLFNINVLIVGPGEFELSTGWRNLAPQDA